MWRMWVGYWRTEFRRWRWFW